MCTCNVLFHIASWHKVWIGLLFNRGNTSLYLQDKKLVEMFRSTDVRERRQNLAARIVSSLQTNGIKFDDSSSLNLGIVGMADFMTRLRVLKILANERERSGAYQDGT